jgi:uncharacterized C2H2 Zn-finger protein
MTDLGQCPNCGHIFKISESLNDTFDDHFDINKTPKGTWLKKDYSKIIIGASTRSPLAFFLVPFMIVWSGGSLGGIYGSQISTGEFNIVMTLFGIPFLIGSAIFWSLALMSIWGKVEITLDKQGGKIFTGLGTIGTTRQFTWDEIDAVKENLPVYSNNYSNKNNNSSSIVLEGKKRISFAIGVRESRRYYLYRALKTTHLNIKLNKTLF